MLWIIGEGPAMGQVFQNDLNHLGGNANLNGQLVPQVYNHTVLQMNTQLAPLLPAGQEIYVLAHSGYDDRHGNREAWIGGRWLDEFANDAIAKFTAAGLSNRTIWFLVCLTGQDIATLAGHLVAGGVTGTTLYMPRDYMYISTAGIPHCLHGFHDVDSANAEVAKYHSDYLSIAASRPTGDDWAGCSISAAGVVAAIGGNTARDDVIVRFDQNEDEA